MVLFGVLIRLVGCLSNDYLLLCCCVGLNLNEKWQEVAGNRQVFKLVPS